MPMKSKNRLQKVALKRQRVCDCRHHRFGTHSRSGDRDVAFVSILWPILFFCLSVQGFSADLSGPWTVTQDLYLTTTIDGDSETDHVVSTDTITLTQTGNTVSYYVNYTDPVSGERSSIQRVGTIDGNSISFSGIAALPSQGISYSRNSFLAAGTISGNRIDLTATVDVAFTYMGYAGTITGHGSIVMISRTLAPAPVISGVSPVSGAAGTTISGFTVYGSNFSTASTISFSGSGISVNSYSVRSASQITASISILTAAPTGKRNVSVRNPDGQSASLPNAFTVASACSIPQITVQPQSVVVDSGEAVTFSVTATGTEPLSYQWYEGNAGVTTTPTGGKTGQFTSPPLSGTTKYWVRVGNSCGQVDSLAAIVTVRPPPVSEINLSLSAGGSVSTSTRGSTGKLMVGYAVAKINSGTTPYGTAVFSYRQNGVVVAEAGVPVSPPTLAARFFVDSRAKVVPALGSGTVDIVTGFAAVNANSAAANLTLKLRNADGVILTQGTIRLAAGEHVAKFLDQLAPEFVLPAGFVTNGLGVLEIAGDRAVSVLALRLTINQRGDLLLTSTPIADATRPAPTGALSFPQIADGGGYQTTLIMMNTSGTVETGAVRLYSNNGSALPVRTTGTGAADSRFSYSIPAGGFIRFVTDGSPSNVNVGWAQLTPASGMTAPVSAAIFSYMPAGTLITESGVPAVTPTTHARIYVDQSGGHDTGLAIANPGISSLRITATAYQSDGVTRAGSGQGVVDLAPMGHDAKFAWQVIPNLPAGFTGVLDLSASAPFDALTLRSLMNGRGDPIITTFPIADVNQAPPAPIIFPQIADGAGYQTQIVLVSPGGVSNTVLNYYGDDGKPLPVIPGTANVPPSVLLDAPIGNSYYGMYAPSPDIAASFSLTAAYNVSTIKVVLRTPAAASTTSFDFTLQDALTGTISTFAHEILTAPLGGTSTQVMNVNKTLPAGTYYLVGGVPGYYGTPATPGDVNGWFMSNGRYSNTAGTVVDGLWSHGGSTWNFTSAYNGIKYYAPAFTVNGSPAVIP
jgi:hypothetical protein